MEKIYKLWTTPRARYYKTLAEAAAAADQIRRKTGYILCITEKSTNNRHRRESAPHRTNRKRPGEIPATQKPATGRYK